MDDLLRDYLKLGTGAVIGGIAAVGCTWACTANGLLRGNVLAGAAIGFGGVMLGYLAAFAYIMARDHG